MFTTVTLRAHERALVLRNGQAHDFLAPGKHRVWGRAAGIEVQRFDLNEAFALATPELRAVLPADIGEEHTVGPHELGLLTVDGRPTDVLLPGRWVLWQARAEVACANVSTRPIFAELPPGFRALIPPALMTTVTVAPYERVLLYVEGRLERALEAGTYEVFTKDRIVRTERVDLREREVQIVGQEVMTADKVTIRINLVMKYRVVDAVRAVEAVADLNAGVYTEPQMAARRYVAGLTIDQLIEKRGDAADTLRGDIAERAASWGLEVLRVDLKDVVLPGEMKTLLNRVIEAEKQAAANVIHRREETAATRALANTARLLESNPTLLRLKELEAWKEMAQSVGTVHIVASPQQLMGPLALSTGLADSAVSKG